MVIFLRVFLWLWRLIGKISSLLKEKNCLENLTNCLCGLEKLSWWESKAFLNTYHRWTLNINKHLTLQAFDLICLAFQVEAGQYCTFVVHRDGGISACGKGSYGRLGLGDSNNQASPKRLHLDARLRRVSSSKGSDGHTIALSTSGQVFTWGDGEASVYYILCLCGIRSDWLNRIDIYNRIE